MHFSHPECLRYSGTRTVYFIMGNCVYVFQSPRVSVLFRDTDCLVYSGNYVYVFQSSRVSPLFRDTDCLLYSGKSCLRISVTWSVFIIQGHGLSSLLWDKDCLHCSGTWSPKEDKVSTLLWHRECLLCYGICLHYYGIASSLVCQSDLSTLVCLVSSLVLAPR